MSETTSWTDHVMNGQTWLRFLFMLLFAPLLGCIGFMILCVALFQFFSALASGESNPQLRALGRDLSRLGVDIVAFLTYNTENKPFAHPNAEALGPAPEPPSGTGRGAGTAVSAPPDGGASDTSNTVPGDQPERPDRDLNRTSATRTKRTRRKKTPSKAQSDRKTMPSASHSPTAAQTGTRSDSDADGSREGPQSSQPRQD